MEPRQRSARYDRVAAQLKELFGATRDPIARMATVAALLHAKLPGYFWTGWYLLRDGDLTVGPYQGPLACQVLKRHAGVCWAAVDGGESVIVPDVHAFAGHIACDPRSRSEIVVPLRDGAGSIVGVLDVDSRELARFDDTDRAGLEPIVALVMS